jgi:hypothetical protein
LTVFPSIAPDGFCIPSCDSDDDCASGFCDPSDGSCYFAEPVDLIPDQVPGVGFLDDAIMVELVVQEIRPELDAYADFCRYRESSGGRLDPRRSANARGPPARDRADRAAPRAGSARVAASSR